jgi:NAD-dependent deacetylase
MRSIEEAADLLLESEYAVALTGAGISKASGIPTYRDEGGLWNDFDARKWANRASFDEDPAQWYARFWQFYDMRRAAEPSAGHMALRDLVETGAVQSVVTQNIDSLDRRAGMPAERLFEVHGHDRSMTCMDLEDCGFTVPTDEWLAANDRETLPTCPHDGELLKPDIILYDDPAVPDHVHQPWAQSWREFVKADALMVVGTTLHLTTWAGAVAHVGIERKKPIVVVNPNESITDKIATLILHEPAEEALPRIRDLVVAQT